MREIKFRGRRKNNVTKEYEWVYGLPVYNSDCSIIDKIEIPAKSGGRSILVKPETVGQSTPWKDKNGVRVFDGDKVRSYHFTDTKRKVHYLYHIIKWDEEKGLFKFVSCNTNEESLKNGTVMGWVYMKNADQIEIVGNIHETPELLGQNKND